MNRKSHRISSLKSRFPTAGIGNTGFTMVELLVAFALMTILMASMISLFIILNQAYTTQNVAASVQQVVRTGINIVTQHIRMAGYNPLKLIDVGIKDDFSTKSVHFSYDLDSDGAIADNEDITFFHEDGKLKRQIRAGNRVTLIDNVTDLSFSYLDANGHPAASREDIKTVLLSMTVSEPAGRKQVLSRTYSTRVICRNLGF